MWPRYPMRINAPSPSSLGDRASIDDLRNIAAHLHLLSPDLKQHPELIGEAINFLGNHADDEWTTVCPGSMLVVREAPLRKVAFVIEEVLNLAYALWCCREHPDLDRLIAKLRSDYLYGALFELRVATNLIRRHYSVRIEKNLSLDGKSTDIQAGFGNQARFLIECKRPRVHTHKHFERCQAIQGQLIDAVSPVLPKWFDHTNHKLDILMRIRLTSSDISAIRKLVNGLQKSDFGKQIDFRGGALIVRHAGSSPLFSQKSFGFHIPPVGEPTPLTAAPVWVFYEPSRGETALIGSLIHQANRQINDEIERHEAGARGIVAIEWDNADQTLDAANQRLSLPQFQHTQAVIAFGSTNVMLSWNPNCSRLPSQLGRDMGPLLGW